MVKTEVRNTKRADPSLYNWLAILLHGILFLIFFQLLSDFIESVYAFGLMGTNIPPEIAFILLFMSPLILLLFRKGFSDKPLLLIGLMILVSRVVMTLFDTRGRMIIAGLGVALYLIYLPSLLRLSGARHKLFTGLHLGFGLTIALALSALLRTLGSGYDRSTFGSVNLIGLAIVVITAIILFVYHTGSSSSLTTSTGDRDVTAPLMKAGSIILLCLGIMSVLLLCCFAFMSPYVIARWTEVPHWIITLAVALVLFLTALLFLKKPGFISNLKPGILLLWNILFVGSLTLTIAMHQIRFPDTAADYPLLEPRMTWLNYVPLILMLTLFPVIMVNLACFARALTAGKPSNRAIGTGFSIASFIFFLMVFAHVFTTVYDYIPIIGTFFRDKFWLVHLVAGILMLLPVLLTGRSRILENPSELNNPDRSVAVLPLILMALVLLLTIVGGWAVMAKPINPTAGATSLKIFTYNIQQGYNEAGMRDIEGQLAVLREHDADIIGLQECDAARVANGNADIVKYLADNLNMHAYYGPKVTTGTFGIALLSKYPIENPRTYFLYSVGEQTAVTESQLTVDDKVFQVYVTHLGNRGPIIQQKNILQIVEGKENVILIGDFNFRPDTEQYRLTTERLSDSWLKRWPQGNTEQGIDPARRIDHIFVSEDIRVEDSVYLPGPESDHPAMITTIGWDLP